MARKLKSDRVLFLTTILLVGLSVVMVYSASAVVMMEKFQRPYLFLTKQAMWAGIGIVVLGFVMRFDYHHYRQPMLIWVCLGFVALALVAVLFSPPVNHARRWFAVFGLGIQPSELAKLAAIFFIADTLDRRMHRINELNYSLLPIADRRRRAHRLDSARAGLRHVDDARAGCGRDDFRRRPQLQVHRRRRVVRAAGRHVSRDGHGLSASTGADEFLDPWRDPLGARASRSFRSIYAVGTGGIWGKGLMNGVQKLFYLPEPHTDFIYSVIAEELGLIGATAVVICFAVIAWRGLRVALRAPDTFGAFLALGLTTMMAVQAFFNISVTLGLLPTKGIPRCRSSVSAARRC